MSSICPDSGDLRYRPEIPSPGIYVISDFPGVGVPFLPFDLPGLEPGLLLGWLALSFFYLVDWPGPSGTALGVSGSFVEP